MHKKFIETLKNIGNPLCVNDARTVFVDTNGVHYYSAFWPGWPTPSNTVDDGPWSSNDKDQNTF